MPSNIQISAVDNELILVAYTGTTSFELCRILSGNNMPVSVNLSVNAGDYLGPVTLNGINAGIDVSLNVYIPGGAYNLVLVGIDWGVQAQFSVVVDNNAYNYPTTGGGNGVVWTPAPILINI